MRASAEVARPSGKPRRAQCADLATCGSRCVHRCGKCTGALTRCPCVRGSAVHVVLWFARDTRGNKHRRGSVNAARERRCGARSVVVGEESCRVGAVHSAIMRAKPSSTGAPRYVGALRQQRTAFKPRRLTMSVKSLAKRRSRAWLSVCQAAPQPGICFARAVAAHDGAGRVPRSGSGDALIVVQFVRRSRCSSVHGCGRQVHAACSMDVVQTPGTAAWQKPSVLSGPCCVITAGFAERGWLAVQARLCEVGRNAPVEDVDACHCANVR